MGLLAPLKAGAQVWLERWFMPNRLFKAFSELSPSVFLGTPEYYDILNRAEYVDRNVSFRDGRLLLCSSSPLEEETSLSFHRRYGRWIQQLYGMMEVSTISCNLDADEHNVASVGRAVDNVLIRIGAGDEIEVFSDTISGSYIGDRLSNTPKRHEWFGTGDRGYIDAHGQLYIRERIQVSNHPIESESEV